ncbi:MAG TPA: VOC family protein [Gemmataceae bacterium]|nr:VOC family protein [Gemmataceae bacterium]
MKAAARAAKPAKGIRPAKPAPRPKRPARPEGMPWLSPYLTVTDADAAIHFYARAFGFQKKFTMPGADGKVKHAEMTYRDAKIMFGPEGAGHARSPASSGTPSPVNLYIYCDDVDAIFDRATAAGAKVVMPPTTMFYGDRVCQVNDPDGHAWSFATNVAAFDPSKAPK